MHKSEAGDHCVFIGARYSLGQIAVPLDRTVDSWKAGGYQSFHIYFRKKGE